MNFTQPLCRDCWDLRHPEREPTAVKEDIYMVCCMCGVLTKAGIYIRAHPEEVMYPDKDE